MNKLIKLAKTLSDLGPLSDSKSIIKLAGDAEVKYLEDLNFKSWIKGRDTNPTGDKREFWSGLQREFQNREGGGPIFGADILSQVKEFDSNRLPKKGGKHFVKWLGRWAREWAVMPVADQNMILDWWSATGGAEEGASFDENMIELLTPAYSLQRATEYLNDEGFYADHIKSILSQQGEEVPSSEIDSAQKIESNLLINNEKLKWIENLDFKEEINISEHEKYMFIVGAAITSDSEGEAAGKINKIKEYFRVHHLLQRGSLKLNVQDLNDLEKIKNIFNKKYKEIEEWAKEVENKSKTTKSSSYISNDVVYDFGDGWKVVYIPAAGEIEEYSGIPGTSHDRILEGDKNGLCLGSGSRLYQNNSMGKIYSVRDESNSPRVTIRIYNNKLEEAKGKNNNPPGAKGAEHANSWFESLEGLDYKNSADFKKFPPTSMEKAKALFDESPDKAYERGWVAHWYGRGIPRLDKDVEERFEKNNSSIIKSGFGKFPQFFKKTLPVVQHWCDKYLKGDSSAIDVLFRGYSGPPTHEVFKTYRGDPLMKMAVEKLSKEDPRMFIEIGLQEIPEYAKFSDAPIRDYIEDNSINFIRRFSDKEWAKPYLDSAGKSVAEKDPEYFLDSCSNKDWANKKREDFDGKTLVEYARESIIKNHPQILVSRYANEDWAKPYLEPAAEVIVEKYPYPLLKLFSNGGLLRFPWAKSYLELAAETLIKEGPNIFLSNFHKEDWAKPYLELAAKTLAEKDPEYILKNYSDSIWAKTYFDLTAKSFAEKKPKNFLIYYSHYDWANEAREDLGGKTLAEYAGKSLAEKDPAYFLWKCSNKFWAKPSLDLARKSLAEQIPEYFLRTYSKEPWANETREDLGGKTLVEYAKEKMNQKEAEAGLKSLKSRLVKLSKTLNAIGLSKEAASVFNLR